MQPMEMFHVPLKMQIHSLSARYAEISFNLTSNIELTKSIGSSQNQPFSHSCSRNLNLHYFYLLIYKAPVCNTVVFVVCFVFFSTKSNQIYTIIRITIKSFLCKIGLTLSTWALQPIFASNEVVSEIPFFKFFLCSVFCTIPVCVAFPI